MLGLLNPLYLFPFSPNSFFSVFIFGTLTFYLLQCFFHPGFRPLVVFAGFCTLPLDIILTEFAERQIWRQMFFIWVSFAGISGVGFNMLEPFGRPDGSVGEVMYTWYHTSVTLPPGMFSPDKCSSFSPKQTFCQITGSSQNPGFNNRFPFYWPCSGSLCVIS